MSRKRLSDCKISNTARKIQIFHQLHLRILHVLKAFQQRKAGGMNLSQRVWNLSEQYKTELEMALSAAIEPGTSAMELAADIKTYLNEPDKMFRRFRYKDADGNWQRKWKQKVTDADGKVHFIDADPKAYHPGRGVYRSWARNAQRLARTEINMAYRKAEQERWKSFDFVVGYEVKITQNGKHVEDICDCLKGKYRKDFKFMGWHPQCMCYTIPILKTEDEFFDDDEDVKSVNEVEDVPQGFKDWVKDNEERIDKAAERGKLPYFIADNKKVVENILEGGSGNGKTPASNDEIETKERANHEVPPHAEEYKSYTDGKIMVSPLHGKDELQSNLELGKVMYELMENTVYLLPNINPKGNNSHLRASYLPKGVKEGKNPDFLCGGRLWDGKECSFENTPKEWKKIKSTLENHFKKAKQQADNFIIKVPEWLEEQTFTAIVENYLAISKKDRWIIICKGNGYKKLYKYTIG